MLADYHVHTKYSDDSRTPMEAKVNEAIRLGLDEICFTDHVDYRIKKDWSDGTDVIRNPEEVIYCVWRAF